ncbi:MAG TPA: hypothetical protein ENJ37_05120 [Deltaproteobacteria bacterium]|nr:hypothetical protein [Deltaproteobacteria bacterium]
MTRGVERAAPRPPAVMDSLRVDEREPPLAVAVVAAASMLCAVLILRDLPARSLWTDEFTSIDVASLPLREIAAWAAGDVHPPLYYVLLHFWRELAGAGETAARIFSVLPAAATVPLVYLSARHVAGWRVGLLTAVMLAVSPLLVLRGGMVRWYTLALALSWASILFFLRAVEGGGLRRWALYAAATTLLIYTHYLPGSIVIGQGLYLLIEHRRDRRLARNFFLALSAVALLYLPQLGVLASQLLYAPHHGSPAPMAYGLKGAVVKAGYTLYAFALGETVLPWDLKVTAAAAAAFAAAALAGLVGAWRVRGVPAFVLCFLIVPLVFLILLTATVFPSESFHLFPGLLLFVLPTFYLTAAIGLTVLPARLSAVSFAVIVAAWCYSLGNLYAKRGYINPNYVIPWREAAAVLEERVRPGELVIATDRSLYYYRRGVDMVLLDETKRKGAVEETVERSAPPALWLQVRDRGNPEDTRHIETFRRSLSGRYRLASALGFVAEDPMTVSFKERLLRRPVPKYKLMIYRYVKKEEG